MTRRRRFRPARRCIGCGHTPAQFDTEDRTCGGPGKRPGDLCGHSCTSWPIEDTVSLPDVRAAAAGDRRVS